MGHPDFRVLCADGKLRIFCTLSGEATSRGVLKLTPEQQASFCEDLPEVFEAVQGGWGRMGMTYVALDAVGEEMLLGALTTAHRNVTAAIEAPRPDRATQGIAARPDPSKIKPRKTAAQPKIKS
jgi:hypothetical protein